METAEKDIELDGTVEDRAVVDGVAVNEVAEAAPSYIITIITKYVIISITIY